MKGEFTWKHLLKFLLEQKEKGLLPEDHDVMMYNAETGDEFPCDIFEIDGRLVMAFNLETLDD